MITVVVNKKAYQFFSKVTVSDLLEHIKQEANGIAVAINEHFIPQSEYVHTFLKDQDSVLIVSAMQGG